MSIATLRSNTRIHLRLLLVALLALGQILVTARPGAASTESFLDVFDVAGYSNDDGSLSWDGPWSEIGEATDPTSGAWTVTQDGSHPGFAIKKTGQDGNGVVRTADLSGFVNATLLFEYRRESLAQPKAAVAQISSTGTNGPWTTLYTISGQAPQVTDDAYQSVSIDISAHLSSSTAIRFVHPEGEGAYGAQMAVYVDHVEVAGELTNHAPVLAGVGSLVGDEGSVIGFTASATDPDGDDLVFSLAGAVPSGASITTGGVFSWTPEEAQGPGSYVVEVMVSDTGSPVLTDTETITITVDEVNQAPALVPPGGQTDAEGGSVSLQLVATDPDVPTNPLSWDGSGFPPGLSLSGDGNITGVVEAAAADGSPYAVTVSVSDGAGSSDQETFSWVISDAGSPVLTDTETITVDEVEQTPAPTPPEESNGKPPFEAVDDVPPDDDPPIPATVVTPSGDLVDDDEPSGPLVRFDSDVPANPLRGAGLIVPAAASAHPLSGPARLFEAISLFTKAFFQTVLAMDLPTLLLGFAAIALIGLRGVSKQPVLFARRSQHFWAVVMLGRETYLGVHEAPDADSAVLYKLGPSTHGIQGTGRSTAVDGRLWVGVTTPAGDGWVDGEHVTEQVDPKSFMHDGRPKAILEDFVGRLRTGRDVSDLVGDRGLTLILADMIQVLRKPTLTRLLSDRYDTAIREGGWSASDFHLAVVEPLLSAYANTPVLSPHIAHAETSLLPSPMRNFRYMALGGSGAQPWLVYFEYVAGRPKIVGFTIDE